MTKKAAEPKPLTPEDFDKFVDYLSSDEYAQREHERMKMRAAGEMILSRAFSRGVIDEGEFMHLSTSAAINGMLVVHPRYLDRLKPIADEVAQLLDFPQTSDRELHDQDDV